MYIKLAQSQNSLNVKTIGQFLVFEDTAHKLTSYRANEFQNPIKFFQKNHRGYQVINNESTNIKILPTDKGNAVVTMETNCITTK